MYLFDTDSLSHLGIYYPNIFTGFWELFDGVVDSGEVVSVREVYEELAYRRMAKHLVEWKKKHRKLFLPPSEEETLFIARMFAEEPRFKALINPKKVVKGGRAADPFVIASAKVNNHVVVTQEKLSGGVVKIPFVCNHYDVECINFEGMMEREGWEFPIVAPK